MSVVTYTQAMAAVRAGHAVAFATGHVDGSSAVAWVVAPLTARQRRVVCRSGDAERAAFALGTCRALHDRYALRAAP